MGCDIHAYIEYKSKDYNQWQHHPVSIRLSRDYNVFAHLAGVRNYCGANPVAAGRGFPSDASRSVEVENWIYVSDLGAPESVTTQRAEAWIASGASKRVGQGGMWVTNPDWHSHSWCSRSELQHALDRVSNYHDSYRYLVSVMELTEQLGNECRLVFWFDN